MIDPRGACVISASADGTAKTLSLTHSTHQHLHTCRINQVVIDPRGAYVISASADGAAKAWSLNDGRPQWTMAGHGKTGATGAVRRRLL